MYSNNIKTVSRRTNVFLHCTLRRSLLCYWTKCAIDNMKSFILIAVLAALMACNDAASIPNEADLYQEDGFVYRRDIDMYQKGDVRLGDIMFHEHACNLPGIPNTVQIKDISYRGNSTTRITGLRMTRLPTVPGHTHATALGTTHITLRVTSAPGVGLFTTVQMWGHYTDWV